MPYQAQLVAPAYFQSRETADVLIEKIREVAFPILVAHFEDVSRAEATQRLCDLNQELRAWGLPEFTTLRYVHKKVE